MTKSKKIWIGILTILPGFLFAGYILFIIISVLGTISMQAAGHNMDEPPMGFMIMMPLAMFIFFLGFALTTAMTIYHVIHISKDNTMSSNDKLIWILVVILLNWLGDVAYWYVKIWKAPTLPAEGNGTGVPVS
jgi:hypothetical protein